MPYGQMLQNMFCSGMENAIKPYSKYISLILSLMLLANCSSRNTKNESTQNVANDPAIERPGGSLREWVMRGELAMVNAELVHGEDVNAADHLGRTPLMLAAALGYMPIIKRLVAAKADLSLRDNDGKTAVIHAHLAGKPEAQAYLLKIGKAEYAYWTLQQPVVMYGDRTYAGRLYLSTPDGQGVLTGKEGIFKAEFKRYKLHGHAENEYPDGSKFVGIYKNNQRNGKGLLTTSKGTYEGDFKDGQFHGSGVETFPDGIRYQGRYRKGMRHGPGVYTTPDGRMDIVEYVDGKRK